MSPWHSYYTANRARRVAYTQVISISKYLPTVACFPVTLYEGIVYRFRNIFSYYVPPYHEAAR